MLAGSTMPCQWIDVSSSSALATRRVTVSPSRQRSSGAGSEPLTVIAARSRPVKFDRRLADAQVELGARQHAGIGAGARLGGGAAGQQAEAGGGAADGQPLDERSSR